MRPTAWLQDRRMQKFRDVLSWWERGELSMMEAGAMLGVSERQFRRYRDQYEESGLEGLVDRRLGKASPARVPKAELERMLGLYRGLYRGWNVKHFHEHLVREHGFAWGGAGQGPRQAKLGGVDSGGDTWTKTQLHAAGLVSRASKRGAHRRKRERKPCEGMMLHQDASREVWLQGQPALDLVVTMDDATSTIYSAILVAEEGTASSLAGLAEVFLAKGLPSSLYTDRGSHYFVTPKAGGAVDRTHLTQVGRALERLGIEHIAAYSPEARGRSERMFGTLQDRLVRELAKAGIGEIGAANAWIKEVYLPVHNARFAKPPALPETGFVAVHDTAQLIEALSRQEERIVARDNTIAFEALRLQLPESPLRHHYVKARVRIHAYPDGTLAVFHGPRRIARYTAAGEAMIDAPTAMSVTACSAPSRDGLEGPRRRRHAAAALLDGACARRPGRGSGRDGKTVVRSNKKTGGLDIPKGARLTSASRIVHRFRPGPAPPTKRTNDVLPKPDNLKSYRHRVTEFMTYETREHRR